MKKKRKEKKKTNQLAVVSRLAFTSGKTWHAQIQETVRPPSVCERGGPNAPVREKERSVGKKKKKKKRQTGWQGHHTRRFEKRGDPVLTFVSERGPCAPMRKGERSWGRRGKMISRCW